MRTSTVLNKLDALTSRIESTYRSAMFFHPSLTELNKQLNEQYPDDFAKWPNWAKERISYLRREWSQRINRDYVAQLYVLTDGSKVICRHAWDNFDEATRQLIRDGGSLPIRTFWLRVEETCQKDGTVTRISTPTDKVYFDSAVHQAA
jgi:hypothetical protein